MLRSKKNIKGKAEIAFCLKKFLREWESKVLKMFARVVYFEKVEARTRMVKA